MSTSYKGYYNIESNKSNNKATIYIYGIIGGWDFEKWKPINTADKFVEDYSKITEDHIDVKINSPGGNIWDGLPIYNTLKNSEKTIHTYVDGIAYSMASLIALSGDKVYGYANSMLMFHNGLTYAYGNAKELRKEADTLEQYDEALSSIIEEKLNINSNEVKEKYLNYSDNYFVGKKAKEIGFFDKIITTKEAEIPENIKNMSPLDVMKLYGNMNLINTSDNNKSNTNMSKTIKAPTIQAVLGYDTPIGANENGAYFQEQEVQALEQSLVDKDQKVTDIQTKLDSTNLTNSKADTAINAALDNAEIEYSTEDTLSKKINLLNNQRNEFAKNPATTKTQTSATADPVVDTPAPVKEYAHNQEANKILNR